MAKTSKKALLVGRGSFWSWMIAASPVPIFVIGLNLFAHSLVYRFEQTPWNGPHVQMTSFEGAEEVDLDLGVIDAGPGSPTVIVFVGNVGSRAFFLPLYRSLSEAGATVVVAPYRGAEGTPGKRRESLFREDARGAFHAVPRALGRDPGPIHAAGYSLGTGLALEVAGLEGAGDVLLVAPYARLCEVMADKSHLPACALPWIDHWDSVALTQDLLGSVTILHGTEDDLIEPEQGQKLAGHLEAAGRLAQYHLIDGAGHNDILIKREVRSEISDWVSGLAGPSGD